MLLPDGVLSSARVVEPQDMRGRTCGLQSADMSGVGRDRKSVREFGAALSAWYGRQRRDLPWRRDVDPYRVWISEVMLQQTRVAAVIPYYERFLRRFPTVERLARARESSVLAAWSGLGYYRRARMLHQAARQVAGSMSGVFPRTLEGWLALPGIGAYTAAAVTSIVYDVPAAVVDGNVERVLRRVTGRELTRKQAFAAAGEMLNRAAPGDHNQAMMELGATVCLPKIPLCAQCPVVDFCATRGADAQRQKEIRNRRRVAYGLSRRNGAVYLVQRPADASLMARMWELPQLSAAPVASPMLKVRHSITNTDYEVAVYERARPRAKNGRWVPLRSLSGLPLTGLTRKVLRGVDALV